MSKYYEYYNPNPTAKFKKDGTPMKWHKGDCAVRAFCKAFNQTWTKTYEELCAVALKRFDMPNIPKTTEAYALEKGMVKKSLPKYMTVSDFAKTHNGTYVCVLRQHLVCVKDNKYYDTGDWCGDWMMKTYYEL